MKLRSAKARNPPLSTTSIVLPSKSLTSLLHSHFQIHGSLKHIIKSLYGLIRSCMSHGSHQSNYDVDCAKNDLLFKLEDAATLSGLLFEELRRNLSFISTDVDSGWDFRLTLRHINCKDSAEELLLLLRCCLLMLCLNPLDQAVTEKLQDDVHFLQRLCFKVATSPVVFGSSEISSSDDFVSAIPFLKKVLEVFLDEVFVDRSFQRQAISDCVISTWPSQFKTSNFQAQCMVEVIAAHFLLSVAGDHTLQTFIQSLVWTEKLVPSRPELCLTVGLSLIKHPVVLSSPVILQSHLMSVVSEAVGIFPVPEKVGRNVCSWKTCLSAFYDSVILYRRQISKIVTSFSSELDVTGKVAGRPFESLFHCEILDRVNLVIVNMDAAWKAQVGNMFTKSASSMAGKAISYVQRNIFIIDEPHRDRVSNFMISLISRMLSTDVNVPSLQKIREMSLDDTCVLASILKVMSSSLLHAARYSKSVLNSKFSKGEDVLSGNTSLSSMLSCFADTDLLPIKLQHFIYKFLEPGVSTNDPYKLMFVHFAGLLSLCIVSGVDILVKACLFLMLVIINILTQKEGGSESLGISAALGSVSTEHASVPSISNSPLTERTSTFASFRKPISGCRAAAKFQRARQLLLRQQIAVHVSDTSDKESRSGEMFLQLFTNNQEDIADLADFIECKPQKDYTSWLLDRGKFRSRRLIKMAKERSMRKRKVYNSVAAGIM